MEWISFDAKPFQEVLGNQGWVGTPTGRWRSQCPGLRLLQFVLFLLRLPLVLAEHREENRVFLILLREKKPLI